MIVANLLSRLRWSRYLRSHTDRSGNCWIWTSTRINTGYGLTGSRPKRLLAHHAAWLASHGSLPQPVEIDHTCHNEDAECLGGRTCPHRPCVRPSHLRIVSHQVNVLSGRGTSALHARKTHCPRGHPYDGANTYVSPKGSRECRMCRKALWQAWSQSRSISTA
jgi:hypothetical protein